MDEEKKLFNEIAKACIEHVEAAVSTNKVAVNKAVKGDYATEIDISVENLIVAELQKRFLNDAVLAEEGYSDTLVGENRIWVIDPICGTTNLGRGITAYCTNIALLENGEIIAACVVDYSAKECLWSTGNGVYLEDKKVAYERRDIGRVIDVDYAAVGKASIDTKDWYGRVVTNLSHEEGWTITSMNTSLSFAYVASRKIDAVVNVSFHLWDVCASVFLVRQMGGRVTDFEDKDWTIKARNLVMSLDQEVHARVIQAIKLA